MDVPIFATPDDLRARWAGMPSYTDETLLTLLEDASQYLVEMCPHWDRVHAATLRRVVCGIVRRSLQAESVSAAGVESFQQAAGPFSESWKPLNPNGDFYLTAQERKALGIGRQRAFSIDLIGGADAAW